MYCAKCGFQNSDQSMYCQKCGAPLSRQNGNGGGYRRSVSPVLRAANMVGSEGIAGALRRLILSPLYLVAAIALSTQVVMYILASVAGNSPLMGAIYSILNNSELGYYMDYSQFYLERSYPIYRRSRSLQHSGSCTLRHIIQCSR